MRAGSEEAGGQVAADRRSSESGRGRSRERAQRTRLGDLIQAHRARKGWSQADLAMRIALLASAPGQAAAPDNDGLHTNSVGNWERELDDDQLPTVPHVRNLRLAAQALGIAPDSPAYRDLFEARIEAAALRRARKRRRGHAMAPGFVVDGREDELDRLLDGMGKAVAGTPVVMLVQGAAGMGKTWLVHEACRRAVVRWEHLAVTWGQCTSLSGPADLFQPFIEILGQIEQPNRGPLVPGRDISAANRDRLIARREGWKEPSPPGHASDDGDRPHRVAQLVEAILAATASGPLAIVLDDLHWADEATAATLYHLVRAIEGRPLPLAVIGTWRPSHLATPESAPSGADPTFGMPSVVHEVIRRMRDAPIDLRRTVEPGRREAFVDAFVTRHGLELAASDVAALVRLSQGVPFHVDAWVRHLATLADAETVGVDGRLPPAIDAVLAEQLAVLPPRSRDLLRVASIQGEYFWAEAAGDALSLDPDDLAHQLDVVLDRQHGLVTGDRREVVADVTLHRYRFEHALTADFVRASMGELERERLHAATAEAMISRLGIGPHALSATIASHLEAGGSSARAAAAWRLAADVVLARGRRQHISGDFALDPEEFDRAIAWYERAETLADAIADPGTAACAAVGLAHCLRARPDLEESRRSALRARAIARRSGLRDVEIDALMAIAMTDYDPGNLSAALATLDEASHLIDPGDPSVVSAHVHVLRSESLYGLARYEESIEAARLAQDLALAIGDDAVWAAASVAEMNCLIDLGGYEAAARGYMEVERVAARLGDARAQVLALVDLGLCRVEQGMAADADRALAAAQGLIDRLFIPRLESFVAYFAGLNAMQVGDLDRAERELRRAEAIRLRRGQVGLAIEPQSALLQVAVLRGDREPVTERRATLLDLIDARGLEGMEHRGRFALALIDASRMLGDAATADRVLAEAVADVERIAATIADPVLRRSFLEAVPAHRRLRELAIPAVARSDSLAEHH